MHPGDALLIVFVVLMALATASERHGALLAGASIGSLATWLLFYAA